MSARMGRHNHQNSKEISRVTAGGRRLTYQLKVIQEPERARACGSGAKSSADRRPVDPPPVVELRIFEGDGPEKEDITFGYSANFFLFATLEAARPIAHGRVHHPAPPQQVPVLTGMPVSGMAYLDRPTEAGYFIFPDLSVRHEGSYKLSFNLYEETKNAEDIDADPSRERKSQMNAAPGTASPDSSFDWRLEVKSNSFTVYSAKKFPGLSESTALSRTVAEQGCRVRIRRDVRMRRRDGKPSSALYEEQNDVEYSRGREGSRSNSGSPRTSLSPDGASSHNQNDPQPTGPYQQPTGTVLGFGPGQLQQQYHSAAFATPVRPSQQTQQPYQPPAPHSYPPQQQIQPQPQYPTQPRYEHERHPHSAFPSVPLRESYEQEPRRASLAAFPPSHNGREFPPVESTFNRPQPYSATYNRPHSPPPQPHLSLPPIIAAKPVDRPPQPSPLAPVHAIAPYQSTPYDKAQERPGAYAPLEARPTKRPHDMVFKSSVEPLHNRQRPVNSVEEPADSDDITQELKMSYKRANGHRSSRPLPVLE